MDNEQTSHLKKLRQTCQRRLRVLENMAATRGGDTPPHIQMEIKDIQETLKDIEAQLAGRPSSHSTQSFSTTLGSPQIERKKLWFLIVAGLSAFLVFAWLGMRFLLPSITSSNPTSSSDIMNGSPTTNSNAALIGSPTTILLPSTNAPIAKSALPLALPSPTPVVSVTPSEVSGVPTQTPTAIIVSNPKPSSPVSIDCSKMIEVTPHHDPLLGVEWKFESIDEDRIIHIWSNHWDTNLPEFKFFLLAGESVAFMSGGGTEWKAQPGCQGAAKIVFERDPFKQITVDEYRAYVDNKIIPQK